MLEILTQPFMVKALIAVIISGSASALIGVYMVLRGLSSIGAAIAHVALAGAAMSLLTGLDPVVGALALSLIFALLSGYGEEKGEVRADMVMGVLFGFSTALAALAISLSSPYAASAWRFLVGDVLGVTDSELLVLAVMSLLVIGAITLFNMELKYTTFDPEGSSAIGLNVRFYRYLLLALTSVSMVVNLRVVGSILSVAFIAIPAVVAYQFSHSFEEMSRMAFFTILVSSILGFLVSVILNLPTSAVIGVILSFIYLVSIKLSVKRRKCKSIIQCFRIVREHHMES